MPSVRSEFVLSIFVMFFNTYLAFIEQPSTLVVPANTKATFRCRHQTADSISWLINGTSIVSIDNPDIIPDIINGENNHPVNTLNIVARPKYNKTEVECVATFFDSSPIQRSQVVMLIVQDLIAIAINSTSPSASPSEPENGFIEVPSFVIVAVGDEAIFRCQHTDANLIEWDINGTSLSDFHPLNITQTIPASNTAVHMLSIQALTSYNQTSVECVAFLDEAMQRREESSSVLLLVQGPLLSITNPMMANFSLVWEPPFTLNLTNVYPDIIYCVDVYNVSCADRQHLVSNCSLTEPTYRYGYNRQQTDLLEYIVIPRSNVQNARNGTPQVLTEEYLFFNASEFTTIITKSDIKVNLCLKYHFVVANSMLQRTLDSYAIQLESTDTALPRIMEYISSDTEMTEHGITIQFNDTFKQRTWSYVVKALTCGGVTLSSRGHISTHELQRIEVHRSQNGVNITSEVLNGSNTSGMFIVAYSITEDFDLHYSINTRQEKQHRVAAEIQGLSGSTYNISVFSLENGIPFARAAALPKSVDLSYSKGVPASQSTISDLTCVYVNATSTETACINCAITNNFDGTCVAIANLKASLLVKSSHGLIEINVNFLNRNFDSNSCGGCIDGVSTNDHVIAVFTYQEHLGIIGPHAIVSQQQPSDNTSGTMQKDKIKVSECDAYMDTNLARKMEPMDPNPAYEMAKACDSSAIKVKACPAYESTKKSMPMEQNPSYGELGYNVIIYETIS